MINPKSLSLLLPIKYELLVCIISLLLLSTLFCHANGKIAEYVEDQKSLLSEDEIGPLLSINIKKLREAKDSNAGALYYAGLLWYFNGHTKSAEIAWKRSARTGASPWKEESLRLVCYQLIKESRYNQIVPFVDSIVAIEDIIKDPEIFTYYSLGLWQNKQVDNNLEKLQELLALPTNFQPTVRRRISVSQAEFNYAMFNAFVDIIEDPESADGILSNLLTSYSIKYSHSEFTVFLQNIPGFSIEYLSSETQQLLSLRNPEISDREKVEIFLSFPNNFFENPMLTYDLLLLSKTQRKAKQNAVVTIFRDTLNQTTNKLSQYMLTIGLAELDYQKEYYASSMNLYKRGLALFAERDLPNNNEIKSSYYKAQWRYLFSIIQRNDTAFFPEFISISTKSNSPEYFSNLIEEYLSFLLQRMRWADINTQYTIYKDTLTLANHKVELLRWESILSRVDNTFVPNLSLIHHSPVYHSDFPFDYLINVEKKISSEIFIENWVSNSSADVDEQPIDRLIQGYIDYGLVSYGYKVALENIKSINSNSVHNLASMLNKHGKITQALALVRIASSNSTDILKNKNTFLYLYPTLYLNIVQTLSDSPVEQALLMGLIREESSFNPRARSYADAIGLMQLLEKTASDIATRIEYKKEYSLTNPNDNITLGYHYFMYLIRVLKSPLKAIASYNGGLGNLWKWEDIYSTDDLIVFADSLPFRETRNYVRKVASSAMIYGLLYFDVSPQEFHKYLLRKY